MILDARVGFSRFWSETPSHEGQFDPQALASRLNRLIFGGAKYLPRFRRNNNGVMRHTPLLRSATVWGNRTHNI